MSPERKRALYEAHFGREWGPPIRTGTTFVRVGVAAHQMRLIALDTVVRQFISDTTIEYFDDDSVRFYIATKPELILGIVRHDRSLRRYCAEGGDAWLYLLSPLCEHCLRPFTEHVRLNCLFQSTAWYEHVPADTKYIYQRAF